MIAIASAEEKTTKNRTNALITQRPIANIWKPKERPFDVVGVVVVVDVAEDASHG